MAGRVLSMEIGQGRTYVVEMDYMAKQPKVYNAFSLETPKDMVSDGVINRNEDFIINLKAEIRKREIKTDNVVFSVASSRIANREAKIPMCKEKSILPLITANAADYFPVDMNQYHLVYNILGKAEEGDQKQYRLSLLAVPNDVTTSYLDLAHSLGMHIKAMDYIGNSVFQVVRQNFSRGVNAVVKVDEHTSLVTIVKDGEIVLQRSVAHGVNAAVENMMELDIYGEEKTYEDAVQAFRNNRCLRRYLNVDVDYQEEEDTSDEIMMSRIMLTENLRYLIGNIGRILEYYVSRNDGAGIDSVALIGLGAEFQGLDDLLSNELGYSVRAYDGLNSLKVQNTKFVVSTSMVVLAAAIGATMNPLQLLTPELMKGEKQQSLVIPFAIMVAGLAIAVALVLVGQIMISTQESRKKDLQKKLDENDYLKQVQIIYKQTNEATEHVMQYKDWAKNNNSQLVDFIEELEKYMPKNFIASNMEATTESVTFTVVCESKEDAATVLQNLRKFKTITIIESSGFTETLVDVGLDEVELDEDGNLPEGYEPQYISTVSFSVTCAYADVSNSEESK